MGNMEIFDNRYFVIHKKIAGIAGLWPTDKPSKKYTRRALISIALLAATVPRVIGMYVTYNKDIDIFLEQVAYSVYTILIGLKFLSSLVYENELKTLYQGICTNWKAIIALDERAILMEHSEIGRILTLAYISFVKRVTKNTTVHTAYMSVAMISFLTLPSIPFILNLIRPLNEPRPYLYVTNAEFFVDKAQYYEQIYVYDCLTISATAFAFMPFDSMYIVSTEHCFGLIAIVKYRLQMLNKPRKTIDSKTEDAPYNRLVEAISFHIEILKFASLLERTFSRMFLILMGVSLTFCSTTSILVLMSLDQPYNLTRFGLLYGASALHLFFYSWPGQKLINYSSDLHRFAYCNEWYRNSARFKRLLQFFMLRCSKSCLLTAGGVYSMGFENFLAIMKASFSFITVLSSFRYSEN